MAEARILVVEDEAIIAEYISSSLESLGYEVCAVVATGEDAIRIAEELHPDLVVMDVVLQGEIDGISAANRIQESHRVPIVFLTAYSDEEMLDRATVAGPFGYLIKPFRDRELHSTIKMALFKHRLEMELRESREWFSVTLRSLGEAVIATDRDGLVKFMNPPAESITCTTEQDAQGRPLREFFPAACDHALDLLKVGRSRQECTHTGEAANVSLAWTTRDGAPRVIDACVAPIRNLAGEDLGSVLVFRDVTARKRVEERLRLLYEVMEQCSEGIALFDPKGLIKFANKAFAAMHGYVANEITGRHLSVLHTDEQMPAVHKMCQETLREKLFSGEIGHKRADGSVFRAFTHNAVLLDQAGDIVGIIGTLRDVTELKQAEQALRASHEALAAYSATLEAKVEERTRDLESSRGQLAKYSEGLEKTNEALKIIIEGIENQKREFEEKIRHSLNLTVRPILEQLKLQETSDTVAFLIKSLEFNFANLFSSFSFDITRDAHVLTPREARICEMIRAGLSSKQIAKVMNISPQTVLVHRRNIRKKLGVDRSRRNLATFLKART
jgi:PAS domain S-box-containing protein